MGRKPTTMIRIERQPRLSAKIYIGRQLWYDAGRPERLVIRRDRSGKEPDVVLLKPSDRGWKVIVPPYRMPKIGIGHGWFHELGLIEGVFPGRVTAQGIEFSLRGIPSHRHLTLLLAEETA